MIAAIPLRVMAGLGILFFVLFPINSDGSRGKQLGAAAVEAGVVPCGSKRDHKCCGDGLCSGPEDEITCMADCP